VTTAVKGQICTFIFHNVVW